MDSKALLETLWEVFEVLKKIYQSEKNEESKKDLGKVMFTIFCLILRLENSHISIVERRKIWKVILEELLKLGLVKLVQLLSTTF